MEQQKRHRLVTRSNFDGIVSTALLRALELVDEAVYVHPKEIEDGTFSLRPDDIVTNLPFVSGVYMAFDHRLRAHAQNRLNEHHALFSDAASVSEVIWEYYNMQKHFGEALHTLVEAASRSKSADFTKEEIRNPQGWDRLIFLTDPRSGLGRFKTFRISNYALMQKLPQLLLEADISAVLEDPDVRERTALCERYRAAFIGQIERNTTLNGKVAIVDLRHESTIYPGNRFMLYTLFPETEISIHIFPSKKSGKTVFALGKSIFHESEKGSIDLHELLTPYGGGGHAHAATCQVPDHEVRSVKNSLLETLLTEKAL